MGINLDFCINTSGQTYPIYDLEKNNTKVGELYNRESFILYGSEGTQMAIKFLGPDGVFKLATIDVWDHPLTYSLCTQKPYSRETIEGVQYYIFKMRSSKPVYKPDGTRWGTVAAGMYVATTNSDVGENHNDWKEINYVKSTSGQWVPMKEQWYSHGYVDTGIASASGYNTIPFYGSW